MWISNVLLHPYLLGGQKEGGNARSPLHSRGSPTRSAGSKNPKWSLTKGNKIRGGCLAPTFSGAQKRAAMLRHPCILGDPQQRGTKSEVDASPLPSRRSKRGRRCYATPIFSGVPNAERGEQNQKWLPQPCIRGRPQTRGQNHKGPRRGDKTKCGYITPAFLGFPVAGRHEQEPPWDCHRRLSL